MNFIVWFIVTLLAGVLVAEGILRIGRLGNEEKKL